MAEGVIDNDSKTERTILRVSLLRSYYRLSYDDTCYFHVTNADVLQS